MLPVDSFTATADINVPIEMLRGIVTMALNASLPS